jgi:hypothetical protein
MTGEGEETAGANASTKLGEATEAVRTATEAVETTSQRIADAIEVGRQPGRPLDRLANLTRETPIQSLAIAFLLGFIIVRRRSYFPAGEPRSSSAVDAAGLGGIAGFNEGNSLQDRATVSGLNKPTPCPEV